MSNKRYLSPFVPMAGKDLCGHKITSGRTNPALFGAREDAEKKLSILSINTWVTGSPSPFKWGTKFFRHLRRQPSSSYCVVRWSGPLKHFGPREWGGGGGKGGGSGPAPGHPPRSGLCLYEGEGGLLWP